jgi:hypothetical protein
MVVAEGTMAAKWVLVVSATKIHNLSTREPRTGGSRRSAAVSTVRRSWASGCKGVIGSAERKRPKRLFSFFSFPFSISFSFHF